MAQYFEVTFLPPPGAVIGNAYCEVYIAGTDTLATIYQDSALTTELANPAILNNGSFSCYFATGLISAGAILQGSTYTIESVGTTDFTIFGASSNTIGVTFVATTAGIGPASGTGTCSFEYDIRVAGGNISRMVYIQNIWQLPSNIWQLDDNYWQNEPSAWGAVNPVGTSIKTAQNIGQLYTGNDLIRGAMRLIQVSAVDVDLTAQELKDGLESLNRMLDSWSLDELMLYQVTREQFPLVTNQNPYSIGYGGDFETIRPTRIVGAYLELNNGSIPVDYPMQVLNWDDYDAVRLKTLSTNFPNYLYYQPSFPLGEIYIYPVFAPNDPATIGPAYLHITSWKPLPIIIDPTAPLEFPPGYWEAIVYGLATRIAQEYQFEIRQDTVVMAREAIKRLKRINQRTPTLQTDVAFMNQRMLRYNCYSDGFGR